MFFVILGASVSSTVLLIGITLIGVDNISFRYLFGVYFVFTSGWLASFTVDAAINEINKNKNLNNTRN